MINLLNGRKAWYPGLQVQSWDLNNHPNSWQKQCCQQSMKYGSVNTTSLPVATYLAWHSRGENLHTNNELKCHAKDLTSAAETSSWRWPYHTYLLCLRQNLDVNYKPAPRLAKETLKQTNQQVTLSWWTTTIWPLWADNLSGWNRKQEQTQTDVSLL